MPLSFTPACLPIAPAGLPHTNPAAAITALHTQTPALLSWPRLPRRSFREFSYVQNASGFPGLTIDMAAGRAWVDRSAAEEGLDALALSYLRGEHTIGALDLESAQGLYELFRTLNNGFHGHALRGHLFGPISLALQLTDQHQRPLAYDGSLLEGLTHHLALRAMWQYRELVERSNDVIICLEEPFLEAFQSPFCPLTLEQGVELIDRVLEGVRGCRGLSATGEPPWAALLETSVELIALDAWGHASALTSVPTALARFLARSGTVVWGIVPIAEEALAAATAESLAGRFRAILDELVGVGLSREQLVARALLSTSASLGRLSVAAAERALSLCAETSALLRKEFALG